MPCILWKWGQRSCSKLETERSILILTRQNSHRASVLVVFDTSALHRVSMCAGMILTSLKGFIISIRSLGVCNAKVRLKHCVRVRGTVGLWGGAAAAASCELLNDLGPRQSRLRAQSQQTGPVPTDAHSRAPEHQSTTSVCFALLSSWSLLGC